MRRPQRQGSGNLLPIPIWSGGHAMPVRESGGGGAGGPWRLPAGAPRADLKTGSVSEVSRADLQTGGAADGSSRRVAQSAAATIERIREARAAHKAWLAVQLRVEPASGKVVVSCQLAHAQKGALSAAAESDGDREQSADDFVRDDGSIIRLGLIEAMIQADESASSKSNESDGNDEEAPAEAPAEAPEALVGSDGWTSSDESFEDDAFFSSLMKTCTTRPRSSDLGLAA